MHAVIRVLSGGEHCAAMEPTNEDPRTDFSFASALVSKPMKTQRKSARKGLVKSVSVFPISRQSSDPENNKGSSMEARPKCSLRLTFHQAFGNLCVPMLLAGLVSLAWTVWLTVLTFAPSNTANFLLNKAEFDDGPFGSSLVQIRYLSRLVWSAGSLLLWDTWLCFLKWWSGETRALLSIVWNAQSYFQRL